MPEPAYTARSHTRESAAPAVSANAPAAIPPCTATMDVTPDQDRMTVTLWGELDLGSRRLLPDLHDILTLSDSGIDLRLDTVGFCDCSGVNVLLDLRSHALGQGKTVTVRSSGRAVGRLLDLTGTRELFTEGVAPESVRTEGRDTEGAGDGLHAEVGRLRRTLQTRPTIDLARGILMASFGLTPEAAWSVLVRTSQNTDTKLHDLAGDLVGTAQGGTLPEQVRRQLTAAAASLDCPP
ncbi:ANTAR domain-containing protein [Streptomyces djakartensis]|uniref:ANTAR domain-containing protein n=1 Tax=Streptomyces djakartensis TaxID=68193 RepID=A0ABQ2ZKA1_9ACTN|nr:ANTAR domain-containing protein [Streptomyces djakartensis]GGY15758.1 hypothetical protein GCM10010384_22090 [Streptomyces djakartensis]